jgi:hypothetical protein
MLTTRELSRQLGVSEPRIREFIMLRWIKPQVPAGNGYQEVIGEEAIAYMDAHNW